MNPIESVEKAGKPKRLLVRETDNLPSILQTGEVVPGGIAEPEKRGAVLPNQGVPVQTDVQPQRNGLSQQRGGGEQADHGK